MKNKFKIKCIKAIMLKIVGACCVLAISIYVCAFGIKKAKEFAIYNKKTAETVVYTIWHIETFEGGSTPRINYIKNIARELEKQNPGLLFNIQSIDPNKLADQLLESVPDIISFGQGVGKLVLNHLSKFDTKNNNFNVREELLNAGTFNGKVYALAYIMSGYALFSHGEKETSIEYGTSGYISPEKAINAPQKPLKNFGTQFETYKNFVYHHDHALLGTARDVFRIDNLNTIGRTNASITPLDSYTDLVQYIARTKVDDITNKFCSLVLNAEYQTKLKNYHLFSSLNTKLYFDGIYSDMENAILNCHVQNVFE